MIIMNSILSQTVLVLFITVLLRNYHEKVLLTASSTKHSDDWSVLSLKVSIGIRREMFLLRMPMVRSVLNLMILLAINRYYLLFEKL